MNPLDLLKMISNPQDYVLKQIGNTNPIINNMISLAQQGKTNEVESIARNICQSKGINFDKDVLPLLENFK